MFKRIKRTSLVLGIALTVILGMSYGTFIFTTNSYRSTEMLVGNLTYGIEITSTGGSETINGTSVSLTSGKTSTVLLKITSLNKIISKYGIDYKMSSGTGSVKYASNTGWLPTGKINENNVGTYEKVIKVVISATTDVTVDFTVTGGFPNNELTEVASGYTRITEKADNVISYNDTLVNVVKKETTNNIYGGESINNYAQYPINEDNTKNIWRILGTYNGIGTKIVSNQVSTTTKSTLSTDLTSFYNTLEKPDNYILATDKFVCTNTSCTSSSYSKVGLISTSEYEMLGGINSYLASSESYFALDNGTIKNITSGGIEETSTTSGLRPAVYLQDYVTVTGSGTVSDPFKLKMPEYAVVLNVINGSAALPSKMITRGENATYEITHNTGYKLVLSSNTCSNGTLVGNVFTITNVTSAQTCTITLTPETYTLTLDANGGSVSTTSKTVIYDSTYGELPTPTRTGYTFNGWKGKNLYSDLYNIEFGELSYSNGIFKQTSDDGTTRSFVLQGFKDLAYVKNLSSQNYDISIGKKTFSFTADGTYNGLSLKINGSKQDNYVLFNTPFLENGKTYTLSFQVINSIAGSISWNNLQIEEGSKATVYEPIYVTSSTKVTIPSDHKLVANWTANTYSVTLNVTNGTGSSTKTVAYGNSATFTVTPNSGYKLELETNTCGGTLSGNTYTISNITSNKTCSITFKSTPTLYAKLLSDRGIATTNRTTFSSAFDSTDQVLYTATEDSKTVHYFAGNVTTNWVKFGKNASNQDLYWRIIRTNSDGGVRLLYHGTSTTATDTYIGTSAFNSSFNNIAYVSYMYGSLGSISNARTNQTNSSKIKTTIDNWYTNNLEAKGYTKYLSTTAVYCNDRSRLDNTYFGAFTRLGLNKTPTYTCTNTDDKFTVDSSAGNGKLKYPIALMTADEIGYAGGILRDINANAWYFRNAKEGTLTTSSSSTDASYSSTGSTWWWLLSPFDWGGSNAYVFCVVGSARPGNLGDCRVDPSIGVVRPSVSLKSCVKTSGGDGSANAPYTIEESTSGC